MCVQIFELSKLPLYTCQKKGRISASFFCLASVLPSNCWCYIKRLQFKFFKNITSFNLMYLFCNVLCYINFAFTVTYNCVCAYGKDRCSWVLLYTQICPASASAEDQFVQKLRVLFIKVSRMTINLNCVKLQIQASEQWNPKKFWVWSHLISKKEQIKYWWSASLNYFFVWDNTMPKWFSVICLTCLNILKSGIHLYAIKFHSFVTQLLYNAFLLGR